MIELSLRRQADGAAAEAGEDDAVEVARMRQRELRRRRPEVRLDHRPRLLSRVGTSGAEERDVGLGELVECEGEGRHEAGGGATVAEAGLEASRGEVEGGRVVFDI